MPNALNDTTDFAETAAGTIQLHTSCLPASAIHRTHQCESGRARTRILVWLAVAVKLQGACR